MKIPGPTLILIAHNLRSCHNVGSLLRTAEGLGVHKVYLSGYTPFPVIANDPRLPHIAHKIDAQIHKTALNAEHSQPWVHVEDVLQLVVGLKEQGYVIAGLEQSANSQSIPDYQASSKVALIVGREVEGIEPEVLAVCDAVLEIPMFAQKESFNVVQAAAMALYQLRFCRTTYN
jgi:23S rRNA (guanosine2251-2'-O)-methyltransferase